MSLSHARRVLICLRYGIGDLVMQLPILSRLRRQCPAALITGVGSRPAIDLLEGDDRLDELVNVHDFGLAHWGDYGTAEVQGAIVDWLAGRRFDVVLDPSHATMGFGKAVWRWGAAEMFDTGNGLEDQALAKGVAGLDAIRETVRRGWGMAISPSGRPHLFLTPEEHRYARTLLAQYGMAGRRPFAVSPVASSPLKRWPVERMAAVASEMLKRDDDFRVLILSGDQQTLGERVWRRIGEPGRTAVVPPLHLRHTGALIAQCGVLLCNDTGLMHLSAAVGTPTVAVFGPTSPDIYAPPGAVGLGAGAACPYRLEASFGPPSCVIQGTCLTGRRSCIDEVSVATVCDTLERVTQSTDG